MNQMYEPDINQVYQSNMNEVDMNQMNQVYGVDPNEIDYMPYEQAPNQTQQMRQMQMQQQDPSLLQRIETGAYDMAQDVERDVRRGISDVSQFVEKEDNKLMTFYRKNRTIVLLVILAVLLYILYCYGVFDGLLGSSMASSNVRELPSMINSPISMGTVRIPADLKSLF